MESPNKYYQRLVSAMIRGHLKNDYEKHELFGKHLDYLDDEEHEQLLALGEKHQLKTTVFKRVAALPETKKVLDVIRGIAPDNILDIGCGRGTFIWRLLDEYNNLPITAIDTSKQRIGAIEDVSKGGVLNLSVHEMDVRDLSAFPSEMFDVTTVLKVLEFIDDVELAISEICRVTKRFIIVLFPAHPDNDSEKKHFFNREQLEKYFHKQDIMQVRFEMMSSYHILIARK